MKSIYFDPKERAREKDAARKKDAEDLKSGKIKPDELQRRNGFLSACDFSKVKILNKSLKTSCKTGRQT